MYAASCLTLLNTTIPYISITIVQTYSGKNSVSQVFLLSVLLPVCSIDDMNIWKRVCIIVLHVVKPASCLQLGNICWITITIAFLSVYHKLNDMHATMCWAGIIANKLTSKSLWVGIMSSAWATYCIEHSQLHQNGACLHYLS